MSDHVFWGIFLITCIGVTTMLLLVHEAGKQAAYERGYVAARRRERQRRMYEARDTLSTASTHNNNYEWSTK
jgi:hypothetical protein